MKTFITLALVATVALAQKQGTQTPNTFLNLPMQECTAPGSCTTIQTKITLDANWRWTHHVDDYVNCYTGNEWDPNFCPDSATCTENCALDGVNSGDWAGTYGITASGNELSLKFKTQGPYSTNIGSRNYLMEGDEYYMFVLLNREFTITIDSSELDCGLNGALYLVEMFPDGGLSEFDTNDCGAPYGTGYCDAQCPHDMKWINGQANVDEWEPSPDDPNSGKGHYGTCCNEMDIWEANNKAQAFTVHACNTTAQEICENTECGDNDTGERYKGVCDKDGCDFASYRMGDQNYYGEGSGFVVDSSRAVTIVTQFLTDDGTDSGDLVEVRRLYVQDGNVIQNSMVNFDGVAPYDSITDEMCAETKELFGDENDHAHHGGMKMMGEALGRGMVLALSLWDDHDAHMLWLDSDYPTDADPSTPGVSRGPCPTTSGVPTDVEAQQADATVRFSDIKIGPIGSTYTF